MSLSFSLYHKEGNIFFFYQNTKKKKKLSISDAEELRQVVDIEPVISVFLLFHNIYLKIFPSHKSFKHVFTASHEVDEKVIQVKQ